MPAATKSPKAAFSTYAEHIEEGRRGTLVMFESPSADELAMLVLPYTYCPNVADILDESNWETIKATLAKADPDGTDHMIASFGQMNWWDDLWATPYDLMLVKAGSAAHVAAEELMRRYEGYPVLNEEDFSEREQQAFSDDLASCLNGLTIVVNGVEISNDGPGYDGLFWALDRVINESENHDSCDRGDVEGALRELGFEYDAPEHTWRGTLPVEGE